MNISHFTNLILWICFLSISTIGYGQENTIELNGVVLSKDTTLSNILIINQSSNQSTITTSNGNFNIEVTLQDTLQFSAVHYQTIEIIVTEEIFEQKSILVDLEEKIINLDEVTIRPHDLTGQMALDVKKMKTKPVITSSTLGLPKAKIKAKTKNERLLFEVDDGKLINYYGIALTINTTKLISKISGRTKMLKNRIKLDEQLETEKKIYRLFSPETLAKELKMPLDHVTQFLDFLINQADFPQLIEPMNDLQILEYLKSKSLQYKKTNELH